MEESMKIGIDRADGQTHAVSWVLWLIKWGRAACGKCARFVGVISVPNPELVTCKGCREICGIGKPNRGR